MVVLSPELALVDPDLAAVARALLPERRGVSAPRVLQGGRHRRRWRIRRREVAIAAVGLLAGTAFGGGISRVAGPAGRSSPSVSAAASAVSGARARAPLTVRWDANGNASYFDFALFRDGRRVLDAWPATPTTVIPAAWTYHGKRYELTSGRYTWFVYPGVGRRAQSEYGALTASGGFVVGGRS